MADEFDTLVEPWRRNMDDGFDLFAESQSVQSTDEQKKKIATLAQELRDVEGDIEQAEALLKRLKEKKREISEERLPAAMDEAEMSYFGLQDGSEVKVEDLVKATLPKDKEKRAAALKWLRDNNQDGIIKAELVIQAEKGKDNILGAIREQCEELGLKFEDQSNVHHMTYSAWAKQQLQSNEDLPKDVLGVYHGRQAKVKEKGKKK